MRSPLIFAGPGVPQNRHSNAASAISTTSSRPWASLPACRHATEGSEGKSLVPIIKGETDKGRGALFLAYRSFQRSVRDERWQLITYPHINKTQLFDLQNDPHEVTNLAADPAQAKQVERLTAMLKDLQTQFADKQPLVSDKPLPASEFDFSKVPPRKKG